MPVMVKIGSKESPIESPVVAELELDIRKTLDGDIMIFDHADIDIVIARKRQKIVSFPKDMMSEVVYGAQDRLFKYLRRKGLIKIDSIVGGSIYGSLEADLLSSDKYNNAVLAIINIGNWIEEERPYYEFTDDFEEMQSDRLTDPDEEESTELGEVPHEETKGTMRPGYNYGPYWQSYTYE
tara:strand:- start:761 stop:1303 length:543 start_codon:yes stop_codon:yes gene_type:complete